ncbi:MAG: hypothetical protein V8Q35_06600 [Alistipes finegoldii]
MNFYKNAILLAGILLTAFGSLRAQVRQTREEYIDRYKSIAVAHIDVTASRPASPWRRASSNPTAATAVSR